MLFFRSPNAKEAHLVWENLTTCPIYVQKLKDLGFEPELLFLSAESTFLVVSFRIVAGHLSS